MASDAIKMSRRKKADHTFRKAQDGWSNFLDDWCAEAYKE